MNEVVLVGRSSSHYTRVARLFAIELGVPHTFRAALDLLSLDGADYAGNPALKIPVMVDERGPLFGTENICRELASRSAARSRVVLRGDLADRRVVNAEEMTAHIMAGNVSLIMAKLHGAADPPKLRRSIEGVLAYLDAEIDRVVEALPSDRVVSFVEAALFCTITHFPFRRVTGIAVRDYSRLVAFSVRFGERQSARLTEYCFDDGEGAQTPKSPPRPR